MKLNLIIKKNINNSIKYNYRFYFRSNNLKKLIIRFNYINNFI